MTPTNQAESEITDVKQFGELLMAWLGQVTTTLTHFVDIPPGTAIQVNDKPGVPGPERVLEGELREGFAMGLKLALMHLKNSPFVIETDGE